MYPHQISKTKSDLYRSYTLINYLGTEEGIVEGKRTTGWIQKCRRFASKRFFTIQAARIPAQADMSIKIKIIVIVKGKGLINKCLDVFNCGFSNY